MYSDYAKVPRKKKKAWLGMKMSRSELRHLIASVQVIERKYPEPAEIKPYEFCPKCGCTETRYENYDVPYPEVWSEAYCARCNHKVAMADNSPWTHCLEVDGYSFD